MIALSSTERAPGFDSLQPAQVGLRLGETSIDSLVSEESRSIKICCASSRLSCRYRFAFFFITGDVKRSPPSESGSRSLPSCKIQKKKIVLESWPTRSMHICLECSKSRSIRTQTIALVSFDNQMSHTIQSQKNRHTDDLTL